MDGNTFRRSWEISWIQSESELVNALPIMKEEDVLGVDTETSGWQIGEEKLCLIQIGLPKKQHIFIIDPLSFSDLSPLGEILGALSPKKIAHNASFEEKQFSRHNLPFAGIIDTLNLSRKYRPDLPNHTLRTCCKILLGTDLSKEEQESDWSVRPLSKSQVEYAAIDAEVVVKVYFELKAIEDRLAIDRSASVPELMEMIFKVAKDRYLLTKDIATELAFLNVQYDMLRELIKDKLIAGEPPYKGEFGEASVKQTKKTEVSVEKVKEVFPEIAPLVVVPYVERNRLKAAMKEYGINPKRIDEVLDTVGFTPRLSLELADMED
jgi:DNA polymerase III epsilon subunit-like protein